MNDRVKSLRDFIKEARRNLKEVQSESQLAMIKELENRLAKLKRRAIECGKMGEASELSVCEGISTVIKRLMEEGRE